MQVRSFQGADAMFGRNAAIELSDRIKIITRHFIIFMFIMGLVYTVWHKIAKYIFIDVINRVQ